MFSGEVLRIVITVLLVLTKGQAGAFTISLKGGGDNHEGYIVTLIDEKYEGRICDDTWDDTDASVACRQLGLGNSGRAYVGTENLKFDGWQGTIDFYKFECTGDEEKLSDCDFEYVLVEAIDCPGEFVAGLRCYKDYDVRLSGSSPNPYTAGRLEIYMNGNWINVCDEGWDDEDAVVACRQFTGIREQERAVAIGGALYGKGTGEVGFANFKCNGSESTLRECAYTSMPDSAQCGHQRDAGVDCNGGPCSSQPCKNNGRCQETTSDGNIVCTCQDGYEGTLCEDMIAPPTGQYRCEPLKNPHCDGLSYNTTQLPNILGDVDQNNSVAVMADLAPLIASGCSSDLKVYACAIFSPPCSSGVPLLPCRSLCEAVENGCRSIFSSIGGQDAASILQCSVLPEQNCYDGDAGDVVNLTVGSDGLGLRIGQVSTWLQIYLIAFIITIESYYCY